MMNTNEALDLSRRYNLEADSYYKGGKDPHLERKKEIDYIISEWPDKGYPPESAFINPKYKLILSKWSSYVGSSYSGISISPPCPDVWYSVVDDFLGHVSNICPDFKISSIKISNGGLKFYLTNVDQSIAEEIRELESVLRDKALE